MDNYLATWLCGDDKGHQYCQVSGESNSIEFQNTYWKCVYRFYKTSILTQKNIHYYFFTNLNVPINVDGLNIKCFMEDEGIEIVKLDYTYAPPENWCTAWWVELFEFDILKYCKNVKGNWLILDADCIIRKSLLPIYSIIEEDGGINYHAGYGIEHEINGLTIKEEREIYQDVFNDMADELYHRGGELIGIKYNKIEELLLIFECLYKDSFCRFMEGKKRLITEEHFFTLIYYRMGYRYAKGNQFIKRMWSAKECDNICMQDNELAIWHLPSEKEFGLASLFKYLQKTLNKETYLEYLEELLAVGKGEAGKQIRRDKYK